MKKLTRYLFYFFYKRRCEDSEEREWRKRRFGQAVDLV